MRRRRSGFVSRTRARIAASLRPEHDEAPIVAAAAGLTIGEVARRFWPRLRPLRGWLGLSVVVLAALPLIEVLEIMLFRRLVDDVLVPADVGALWLIALAFVGLNLLSAVLSGADDYLSTWISQRFLVDLRRDAFDHVLALPAHDHDRRRLGDTVARLTSDVSAVERFMVRDLTEALGDLLRLIFYVGAMVWLQWQLALVALTAVPLLMLLAQRFGSFTRDVSRERRRRGGSLTSLTEESLGNAALVQLYGREREAVAAYQRQNRGIAAAELAASRIRALFLPIVDLVELLGVLLVVGLGVWALATDRLTLGGLLAFLALLAQCYRPIRRLADLLPDLYSATAGAERVVELLDRPLRGDPPGARALSVTSGELSLEGVRAAYESTPVLTDFDLRVAPGERVALAGPSGSGKTTVVRLLTGQLEPAAGRVLIDGQDLSACTSGSVRAAVTVVPQETLLPDDTVSAAISFSVPGADREAVEGAARAADAHEFVRRLPNGYDTRIGQRGRLLSGGQRQRLSLARALLRDSPILVLDEPTTGLDRAGARRFLDNLLAATAGRTLVVLSHDPVVLERMDRVVELPDPPRTADR